jgi:Flagellar protein FliT
MHDYPVISEKILDVTRTMLESARASEWGKVQYHQRSRQLLLKDLDLSRGLSGHYGNSVAADIQEILSLNVILVELSVHAKTVLEKTIGSIQRGRKASLAYGKLG